MDCEGKKEERHTLREGGKCGRGNLGLELSGGGGLVLAVDVRDPGLLKQKHKDTERSGCWVRQGYRVQERGRQTRVQERGRQTKFPLIREKKKGGGGRGGKPSP